MFSFWHWLAFAAIFLILEVITGSGFLLWIGISAAVVSGILFFIPEINLMTQMLGFAFLSFMTAMGWWLYFKRNPIRTDKPTLNKRGHQYVGRVFTLESPVVNGLGKIHVDDTSWRIRCVDLPAGRHIRVTGVDGVILLAEPVIEH